MKTGMLRLVRKHFVHDMAPVHIQRANIRKWVMSVRHLGDRWLLAKSVARKQS